MYEEKIFKGNRVDFLAFIQAHVDKSHFPGFSSHCPTFSLLFPEELTLDSDLPLVKILYRTDYNTCRPVTVIATKLPDNQTLLTGKFLDERNGSVLNIKDDAIAYAWRYLISLLEKQGWLVQEETAKENLSSKIVLNLSKKIRDSFSMSDLRDLFLDVGLDFEEIDGSNKKDKSIELVLYFHRRNEIQKLIKACSLHRPRIFWESF